MDHRRRVPSKMGTKEGLMPTYGSLFSGIDGLGLGLDRAGWDCKWQVEIEPQCREVLKRHWPDVPKFNDIMEVGSEQLEQVDCIIGGFPCTDISVAGCRTGLAGERSGLFYEFMRILDELTPTWVLIENVQGLLSSSGCTPRCEGGCIPRHGGDMGAVIGALAERGYGLAWRLLDAQYAGVAQRRKRVFLVANSRDWTAPAQVLFEPESLQGDPPARPAEESHAATSPEGSAGKDHLDVRARDDGLIIPPISGTLGGGSGNRGWCDDLDRAGAFIGYDDPQQALIPVGYPETARCLSAPGHGPRYDFESETLVYMISGASDPIVSEDLAQPLMAARNGDVTCINQVFRKSRHIKSDDDFETWVDDDIANTLNTWEYSAVRSTHAVIENGDEEFVGLVRRLTPLECERLMGFDDEWTKWDSNGKQIADSPRYKMLGNSVAVPCAEWIAKRMMSVHNAVNT